MYFMLNKLKTLFMSTSTPIPEEQGQDFSTSIEDLQLITSDASQVLEQGETDQTDAPEGYVSHTVTEEDLNENPGSNLNVGETIYLTDETIEDPISESKETSETQTVEPEVTALIEKYSSTHWVKVYKSEDSSYWEVFLGHNSALPMHNTCNILRDAAAAGTNLGFHKFTSGTKEEVMSTITSW